jgi:D-arabinose 1-dehydrogenase-like Zn-dependent alcohol dehydrogenase
VRVFSSQKPGHQARTRIVCKWMNANLNLFSPRQVKTHITVEPMSKLNEVFEKMDKGQLQGRVVLDLSG